MFLARSAVFNANTCVLPYTASYMFALQWWASKISYYATLSKVCIWPWRKPLFISTIIFPISMDTVRDTWSTQIGYPSGYPLLFIFLMPALLCWFKFTWCFLILRLKFVSHHALSTVLLSNNFHPNFKVWFSDVIFKSVDWAQGQGLDKRIAILKGSTKARMLCLKSETCSAPVRNS